MYVEVTLPSVKFLPQQRMAHSQTLCIRFSFYMQGSLCQIRTKDLKAGSSGNLGSGSQVPHFIQCSSFMPGKDI